MSAPNELVEINLEYERRLEASEVRRRHLDLAAAGDPTAQEIVAGIERAIAEDVLREHHARRGGRSRALKLTPEQRSASARKAGLAGGRGRPKRS